MRLTINYNIIYIVCIIIFFHKNNNYCYNNLLLHNNYIFTIINNITNIKKSLMEKLSIKCIIIHCNLNSIIIIMEKEIIILLF